MLSPRNTPLEISPVKVCLANFSPPEPQGPLSGGERGPRGRALQEVQSTLFCPSQEKFHTVVLDGVRNILGSLQNHPAFKLPREASRLFSPSRHALGVPPLLLEALRLRDALRAHQAVRHFLQRLVVGWFFVCAFCSKTNQFVHAVILPFVARRFCAPKATANRRTAWSQNLAPGQVIQMGVLRAAGVGQYSREKTENRQVKKTRTTTSAFHRTRPTPRWSCACQEAKSRPNMDWQEKIHRGILRGLRNISETP